jgi:hypothetical protein
VWVRVSVLHSLSDGGGDGDSLGWWFKWGIFGWEGYCNGIIASDRVNAIHLLLVHTLMSATSRCGGSGELPYELTARPR